MKRRSRRREDADDTYQVDAIVSLLAILLVLLLAMAAATAKSERPLVTDYRPDDGQGVAISLRSLQLTFRSRETWLVGRNGMLILLDLPSLIAALDQEGTGLSVSMLRNGVDAALELNPDEPGSFRLTVVVDDSSAGEWAIANSVDSNDAGALAGWAAETAMTSVFVIDDAIDAAARIDTAMRAGARRGSLVIPRTGVARVTMSRSGTNFSMERIYRAN